MFDCIPFPVFTHTTEMTHFLVYCAFSWINNRRDNIKIHGKTIEKTIVDSLDIDGRMILRGRRILKFKIMTND